MVVASGTLTCVHLHVNRPLYHCAMEAICYYWRFLNTTPWSLFRKLMLLDRDFLSSAPGLCSEISSSYQGAHAQADKTNVKSRSKFLGLDSHYQICVEVLGKFLIPCCFCTHGNSWYLMKQQKK